MLVLSRKPLEQIRIGSDIRITVVKVERNQVRLGIEAPETQLILRAELLEAGARAARPVDPALAPQRRRVEV
jgi:carbon storage regulator